MENIRIEKIEAKKSSTGRAYLTVATDKGKFGVWDNKIIAIMQIGRSYDVEIEEKNGFKTIKKAEPSLSITEEKIPARTYPGKDLTTMYVSYAKDIFIAMLPAAKEKELALIEVMKLAIEIVKLARGEFENGN